MEYDDVPTPSRARVVGFVAIMLVLAAVIAGFTAMITLNGVATLMAATIVLGIGALWLPRVWRGTPPPRHRPGERPGSEDFGPLGQPNTAGLHGGLGSNPGSSGHP